MVAKAADRKLGTTIMLIEKKECSVEQIVGKAFVSYKFINNRCA